MFLPAPLLIATMLLLTAAVDSRAQSAGNSPFEQEFLRTFPAEREEVAPQLSFKLLEEIELPGPLPGIGPTLVGNRIAIPVAGYLALTTWGLDATAELSTPTEPFPAPTEPIWVEGPEGRRRYRTLPEGRLVAEKRCRRCDRGWRKRWKLRIPGSTLAPPLVTEERIFVGAMDNRIYCLKRRNGHRLWTADAESRLARRLVLATVERPATAAGGAEHAPLELVLAVPDDRAEIQAWSAKTGQRVATFSLAQDEGKLIGVPLRTPDDRIVVARQWYASSRASLMVLQLSTPEILPADATTSAEPPAPAPSSESD